MTPHAFLEALWLYKPEEMYILIWTALDKRSHWFRTAAAAADFVASDACREKCVFVGIGLSKTDNGPTRRCTSDEVAAICGIWADLDLKSEAHKDKALPTSVADALSILPKDFAPTITVATGNGAHAWWLFKEPLVFDTEEERRDVARVVNRWHTMLRLDCGAHGWVYDRLADFARVARVPGTRNMKDPARPKDVLVISANERRYNLSDFEEYLDDAAIPDLEAQEQAAREWAERFKDTPLVINSAARIPQEMLEGWMQLDLRFKNTWLRQRHDLKDQTQSGYDLALADFGILAGLSEQQIVDLIVHHRTMHGQKQRTRIDYFQRTIAKASSRNPDAPRPNRQESRGDTPAEADSQGQEETALVKEMSPERAKAELCAKTSIALGIEIQIARLVRITGKDPSYRMELADGTKIEFASIGKFVDQNTVRLAIAAQKKELMPQIKPSRWREVAQDMLRACFDEDGPIEAQWEESARDTVARYLDDNGFIDDIASAHPQYRGKPVIIDGRIAINTTDFHAWINKTTFQNLSVKALASMLGAMGAEQRRITGKHRDQSRWLLPLAHFGPADYQKGAQQQSMEAGDAAE